MLRSFFLVAAIAALSFAGSLFALPALAEPVAILLTMGEPFAFALALGAVPVIAWVIVALTRDASTAGHQVAPFATFLRPQTGLPEPTSVA